MWRKLVDALVYAGVLTAIVFVAGATLGLTLRGNLIAAKRLLFLVGFLLLGYSSLHLRPTPLWKRDEEGSGDETDYEPRGIQALVANSMPVSLRPTPDERLSPHAKLFVAALVMLLTSFLLEVLFGVGVA